MIILQKRKLIVIITVSVILTVLCIVGVLHLNQANDWLRFLQGKSNVTEHEKPERQSSQTKQTPEPIQTNRNPNQKPTTDFPTEPHEMPEEYPGNQDLDDYGNWLEPYKQPEPESLPAYRNEAITIPKSSGQ